MTTKNIVFIDSRVAGYPSLIDSLIEPYEVFVLDGDSDGLDQMAAYLTGRTGLDAIHVVSHGSPGALYLGSTVLDSNNLSGYEAQLHNIGSRLTQSGDILLYGCDVAQGVAGAQFVQKFAEFTRADIAASDDLTGPVRLNGDSFLEQTTGLIESKLLDFANIKATLAANTAPTFMIVGSGKISTDLGTTDFSASNERGQSIAVQSDGKIIVAGYKENDFLLCRYNQDGSLDTSFSNEGVFIKNITYADYAYDLKILENDSILVAGSTYNGSSKDGFAILKLDKNGTLDETFGVGGMSVTDFGWNDYGKSICVQSDGKFVVAGYHYVGTYFDFAIARYNQDGSLDNTFSNDGKVLTSVGGYSDYAYAVAIQEDGGIIIGGASAKSSGTDVVLARYTTNGELDKSFNGNGLFKKDFGSGCSINSILIQKDGKILAAGTGDGAWGSKDFLLIRLNPDGSLDNYFGSTGIVRTPALIDSSSNGVDKAYKVLMQDDGRIYLIGESSTGYFQFAVARYNQNGSLDTTYGPDSSGKLGIDFGNKAGALSATLDLNGSLLLAGYNYDGTSENIALSRLTTTGTLDLSFGSYNSINKNSIYIENSNPIIIDDNIKIFDAELSEIGNFNGSSVSISRSGGANPLDEFSIGGSLTLLGSDVIFSGTVIGSFVNDGGALIINFNSQATREIVNETLSSIKYENISDNPEAFILIDWIFSDGNTGVQGWGGALKATGRTTVSITTVNDAPTASGLSSAESYTEDTALNLTNIVVTDVDSANVTATLTLSNAAAGALSTATAGTVTSTFNAGTGVWSASGALADVNTLLGEVTFNPALNFNGDFTLATSVSDGLASAITSSKNFTGTAVNDAPTGSVTIAGTATQGQTLTASNTLADADGLGSIAYQWKSNGVAITGANASTYTLKQTEVGKTITVTASYTDLQGTAESKTSAATLSILNGVIDGTTGNDTLMGTYGADTLSGLVGYDLYYVNHTSDTVAEASGAGTDTVYSYLSSYTLTANVENGRVMGAGSANLTGNALNNLIYAGAGNNNLVGGDGIDTLSYAYGVTGTTGVTVSLASTTAQTTGGSGSDTLSGFENLTGSNNNDSLTGNSSNNVLNGGLGTDTLAGGAGDDTYYVDAANDVITETSTGGKDLVLSSFLGTYVMGNYVEEGRINTTGAANLTGNNLSNILYAGAGNNILNGGAGTEVDTVSYQYGLVSGATLGVNVSLAITTAQDTGRSGSDTLINIENITGSSLNDTLTGSDGNNVLDGGLGSDRLIGGLGNDTYVINTSADVIVENANEGTDTVNVLFSGYTLGDNIENGRISTTAAANLTGNSLGNTLYAGAGNNILNGGTGTEIDTVSYADAISAVKVSLAVTTGQATLGSGTDTLINIENLTGSNYNDTLTGSSGNNVLDGGAGDDNMAGGLGNDTYYVRQANDIVIEAASAGTDTVYSYLTHTAAQTYALTDNVENGRIVTTAASNMTGNAMSNTIYAGAGNNLIDGGSGTEIDTVSYLYGLVSSATTGVNASLATGTVTGSGTDTLTRIENLIGSSLNDTLIGNAGNNVLNGGSGNDSLSGGDGEDILIGGAGKDTLVGGNGNDVFDFNALTEMGTTSATWDVISSFVRGQDKIDLASLDAKAATTANEAFSFIGSAAFSADASGQLRYVYNSTNGYGVLYGSTDADTEAEFAIQINGVSTLTATDFWL